MGSMGDRAFKQQLYGQFARLGKALASASRLELSDLLADGHGLTLFSPMIRHRTESV